jgi:hypothetical protein
MWRLTQSYRLSLCINLCYGVKPGWRTGNGWQ